MGLPGWRPGVCVRPAGEHEMVTAQRANLHNMAAPDTLPLADEPGICTGLWRAVQQRPADVEGAPAGDIELED